MVFTVFLANTIHAQEGTVMIACKRLSSAPVDGISIFMDGRLICDLNDNSFGEYAVHVGKHTFIARWNGGAKENILNESIQIDVTHKTEFYLRVYLKDLNQKSILLLEEVSGNAWPKLMTDLNKIDCL